MAVDSSGIRQAARQEAVDSLAQRGSLICVGNGEGIVLAGRALEKNAGASCRIRPAGLHKRVANVGYGETRSGQPFLAKPQHRYAKPLRLVLEATEKRPAR